MPNSERTPFWTSALRELYSFWIYKDLLSVTSTGIKLITHLNDDFNFAPTWPTQALDIFWASVCWIYIYIYMKQIYLHFLAELIIFHHCTSPLITWEGMMWTCFWLPLAGSQKRNYIYVDIKVKITNPIWPRYCLKILIVYQFFPPQKIPPLIRLYMGDLKSTIT